jgi:hypothetical protein
MSEDKFQAAIDAATGERTAEQQAASANFMQEQLASFEARVAAGDYAGRPDLIESTRTRLQAIVKDAGIPLAPPPKTVEQLAAEHRVASFPLGDIVNENLASMLEAGLDALVSQGAAEVQAATARLKEELGAVKHAEMVANAKQYLGPKFKDAVAGYLPALRVAASQAQRNAAKLGR